MDQSNQEYQKELPSVVCEDCGRFVRLLGLNKNDGLVIGCDCLTLDSLPYELGRPELPEQWEVTD